MPKTIKTKACKLVLQLMDKDLSYNESLKVALKTFPKSNKARLEKELNKYI